MAKKQKSLNVKDYERLGRMIESIFEGGFIDHKRVYRINFVRGIFFGVGSILGSTMVIAGVIWLLSLFTELPLIGNLVETVKESIQE